MSYHLYIYIYIYIYFLFEGIPLIFIRVASAITFTTEICQILGSNDFPLENGWKVDELMAPEHGILKGVTWGPPGFNGLFIYIYPIPSMYGIFTYICLVFMVNVGKYTCNPNGAPYFPRFGAP